MNDVKIKILLATADHTLSDLLEACVQTEGFEFSTVSSADEALASIEKETFAVALIAFDLLGGYKSNTNLITLISEHAPAVQCIVLDECQTSERAAATFSAGSFAYLDPRIGKDCLFATIRNALNLYEMSGSLEFARKRYAQIFENTKDGIASVSLEGHFTGSNPAFQEMVGYSKDELMGMSMYAITPKRWHDFESKILSERVLANGFSDLYEKEYTTKNGTNIPVEISAHLSTDAAGKPVGFWAFMRNISSRKLTDRVLRQQLKEVSILQDLTTAGADASDIDDLLQRATRILGESLYPENFGIFIFDPKERLLRRHYSYQTNVKNDALFGFQVAIEEGIIGRAYRTRTPQRVSDVSQDPDYIKGYNASLSEIAVPILIDSRIFGVINAESSIAGRFTEKDEKLLISLANQLAISIAKMQVEQAREQRTREIAALYDTAIATTSITETEVLYEKIYDRVRELFPLNTFSLVEYEPHDETIKIQFVMEDGKPLTKWMNTRFEKDQSGLIGWVIQNQKPFLFHDLQSENLPVKAPSGETPARSWLGVPLIAKGKVVGGLSVQSFSPNAFDENHRRLLESLAALLAGVINSAHLIERSQGQISRLEALHDIDLVINSSMDLRVTLNILLDQVIEKLQVDAAVVLLHNLKTNMLEYSASRGFHTQSIKNYSLPMGEELSGKDTMERHLIQALNLDDGNSSAYTNLMDEERFVSYYSVPLIAKGQVKGVLDIFNRSLLNPDQEWFNFLETLGVQAAIAIDNASLLDDLHRSNTELRQAYDTTLEGWSKALDLRDKETEGHTQRVVDVTLQIAKMLGVSDEAQTHIRRGALLHDIGKMGIPDSILLKPGPLSDDEWVIMHMHPVYAYQLLHPIKHLRPALDIPYCHHEHWDGSGYPRGLKGDDIPIAGRIFAVVDVWDALTSDRPYRKAWTAKKAIDYIRSQRGKYFDPEIVDIFLSLIKNELINQHVS